MLHPVAFVLVFSLGFIAFLFLSLWYVYRHNRKVLEIVHRDSKVWTICPDCGHLVWLQTFLCPACKTENSLHPLMDADFNVHLVQSCGNSRCGSVLPVSHYRGREQLTAVCPECSKPIGEQVGIYHELIVPIIGSRSTGKSAYLSALLFTLRQKYGTAIKFPFPELADYAKSAFQAYTKGYLPDQTPKSIPKSFVVDWENRNKETKSKLPGLRILFYDAGGEIYDEERSMGDLKYLDFMDGLILIVDPFTLHEVMVNQKYAERLAGQTAFQRGEYSLEDTVARIRNGFGKFRYKDYDYENLDGKKEHLYLATNEVHFCRCLIVITKTDMFDLDSQVGDAALAARLRQDPNLAPEEALHQICFDKLCEWGLENELKILNELFREVRCFSVSALGHLPEPGKRFEPHRVELPLEWLLKQRNYDPLE